MSSHYKKQKPTQNLSIKKNIVWMRNMDWCAKNEQTEETEASFSGANMVQEDFIHQKLPQKTLFSSFEISLIEHTELKFIIDKFFIPFNRNNGITAEKINFVICLNSSFPPTRKKIISTLP